MPEQLVYFNGEFVSESEAGSRDSIKGKLAAQR